MFRGKKYKSSQAGLSLIEVSLGLILIGILVAACLNIYRQHLNATALRVTEEHMRLVAKALSDYVVIANRLPCPANPAASGIDFGWESGVAAPTVASGQLKGLCKDGDPGVRHGMIPYQVLNIPYEDILDGWGRYISYAVSPVYTQDMDNGINDNELILPKCREAGWVGAGDHPVNGSKARFCCSWTSSSSVDSNTDLIIHKAEAGYPIISGLDSTGIPARPLLASGAYQPMNVLLRDGAGRITSTNSIENPAFALISHGENGYCSFLGNNTANQLDCASASVAEQMNKGGKDLAAGEKIENF